MNSQMEESLSNQTLSIGQKTSKVSAYEALPDAIRMVYSEKEYLWLSAAEKASLEQRETEPEYE